MPKPGGKGNIAPIVIKRIEEGEHAHHGGAWKIAYADFVTAMMAFFLLMWLVNATTEAQRRGIADYFAQPNDLARGPSGSGQPFGGRSLYSDGPLIADAPLVPMMRTAQPGLDSEEEEEGPEIRLPRPSARQQTPPAQAVPEGDAMADAARRAGELEAALRGSDNAARRGSVDNEALRRAAEAARQELLTRAAEEIRQAVRNDPALASLGRQLIVEEVPEGLRIQLVDAEGQPVFETGRAAPNERGRALLLRVAQVLARLPHPIEVTGHTDAAPFRSGGERSNWDLSAERANATRRLLVDAGITDRRMRSVTGRAERELLVPANPLDAANRRVAVLMLLPAQGVTAP
ncbi:flagellar motor protein MotB [Falsiroseomonas stagni]|uniref:Chemotaxis protein MotB n=1 Tax=Falsiroseomonas stagni DSM 19981 TaxID=1123062 RepID=A0A1I3X682_9PROT|nr:flagellar motor protein MotB [Falsiroseomonas stagni]SFK15054.1 chemotaxis protein MotB [Falsiroseomonas stagni DSM 19981]